jgi:phage/plasmid-like protein (TIGR03299 family)
MHYVETMAYTNEVPWHGLGFHTAKAKSANQMLKLAKCDWTTELREMVLKGNSHTIPGFYALTRNSDNRVLDIVGSRYVPIQNKEVFEFFKEFVDAGKATMETAGSLKEGKYVWGLANLNKSFKLKNDDKVNGYLLVIVPHIRGKTVIFKFTTVRVVCWNTLSLGLNEKGTTHRVHHRSEFDNLSIENAKEALGIAREQLITFEKNAKKLQAMKLTKLDRMRIIAQLYMPEVDCDMVAHNFDELASSRARQIMDVLNHAPGAEPSTGWGMLNAVTYHADHLAGRTTDNRLTNAWIGQTAKKKEEALQLLLER